MAVVGSLKVKTFLSATSLVTNSTIIVIIIITTIIITIIIILTIFSSTLAMMHWVTGYHLFVIWGLRQLQQYSTKKLEVAVCHTGGIGCIAYQWIECSVEGL